MWNICIAYAMQLVLLACYFFPKQRKNSIHNICEKPLSWARVETTDMPATKLLIDLMYLSNLNLSLSIDVLA